MKMSDFHSNLAPAMQALLRQRQALGYRDKGFWYELRHFDRYLASVGWKEPGLTRKIVEDWAASNGPIRPATRAGRIGTARALARFLSETVPDTYIPGPVYGLRSTFRPHIYTVAEVQALLAETARLSPAESIRPKTFVTLFALLYTTGLRLSEALKLTLANADLESGVLTIRESKFYKSRQVPLDPSGTEALRQYREVCAQKGYCQAPDAPLLVNVRGRSCRAPAVSVTFLQVARRAGLRGPPGTRGPRLHDLRHTFAVHRLLAWYRDGGDIQSRLPLLSTYMGHVGIASTQVYLDVTAELLQEAARRFQPPSFTKPFSFGGQS